jgi:succinate dehydrogenase / fumarate reductase membrane anchor subunit
MTMNKPENLINPLAKARGLGPAHEGVHHWLHQRITAVINIPLMLWLVWSVTHMTSWDYATFTGWLAQPVNAILMILAVLSVFYHASLGAQVMAEDYIHNPALRMIKLTGMKLFFMAAVVACVFSILKIAFGG